MIYTSHANINNFVLLFIAVNYNVVLMVTACVTINIYKSQFSLKQLKHPRPQKYIITKETEREPKDKQREGTRESVLEFKEIPQIRRNKITCDRNWKMPFPEVKGSCYLREYQFKSFPSYETKFVALNKISQALK